MQSSIRGDPEAALLWVSKSQRHLSAALAELGFTAGQKLVGRLLRRLGFSLQANSKTREGASHPDRNAQFEHINAQWRRSRLPVSRRSRSTPRRRSLSATSRQLVTEIEEARELPLGLARLLARPIVAMALSARKTIGIVEVALFAANAEGVPPVATITSTLRLT